MELATRTIVKKGIIGAAACAAFMVWSAGAARAAEDVVATSGGQSHWVATWSSAPIAPGPADTVDSIFGDPRYRTFENQTVRNIAHVSAGGRRVRVRVSNAFGTLSLRVGAANVALRRAGASIWPQSNRRLTWSGQATIVIPAGAVAVSDAVDLDVPTGGDLAVSLYLPGNGEAATYHEETRVTSYVTGAGNFAAATDLTDATPTDATFYASVVEVLPAESLRTVVVFGDSLAQGAGSTLDAYLTWPDQLAARLNPNPQRPRYSVINQGVGCGRLLFDFCGPAGAARFDRDVLTATGATHVIVHIGLNDITIPSIMPQFGHPEFAQDSVSANDIIVGLSQIAQRARAQGLKVIGATITPFGSSAVPGVATPENEAKRQAVNKWIRTGGAFDGIVDFDAAVRDPALPTRLKAGYDFDGIHLTDAGYTALANAVNLALLF